MKECKACKEEVKDEAIKCHYCGYSFSKATRGIMLAIGIFAITLIVLFFGFLAVVFIITFL